MARFTFEVLKAAKSADEAKADERGSGRPGTKKTTKKRSVGKKLPYDPFLAAKGCDGCPLNEADLEHPKMPPSGAKRPLVYVLGEAPSVQDDSEGEHFVGKSGKLLRKALPEGYEKITRFNNVTRCWPGNSEPGAQEIACCRKQNEKDIEDSKPKIVIGTGSVPLHWMIRQNVITGWRGRKIPCRLGTHKFLYAPVFHPSYVMRSEHTKNGKEISKLFKRDLEYAYSLKERPEPIDPSEANDGVVLIPCDIKALREAVDEICAWGDYAIDLETNGLRPFIEEPRILTVAVSKYDETYAFALRHRESTWTAAELKEIETTLIPRMLKAKGKRISHNSKFEQEWLVWLCGDWIVHEVDHHDTLAQAYARDERGSGTRALGSLVLIYLGFNVKDLSDLDTTCLDEYPLSDVLKYNAYDAKYTYALFLLQQEELERNKLTGVYEMHNDRAGPIVLATSRGILPNKEVAERFDRELTEKIKAVKEKIAENKDVLRFNEEKLSKRSEKSKKFSPTSNADVLVFFKNVLPKDVAKLIESVGEEVISEIDHPVARWILELRGYSRLHNTYVLPLMPPDGKNIWPDGLIHTEFHHLKLVTGRTSSSDPNLQNLPYRKGKEIRDIIKAPKGHKIVSADYGQIEARVIGMASHDKFLCKALWENYDVHTEWTEKIAHAYPRAIGGRKFLNDKSVMKKFRDEIKNKWTFPLYYGSILSSVSNNLEIPENTLAPLYDEFWETFNGVYEWQQELVKFYRTHHYVEALTGRRRHAPMGYNEIINTPIQGTASDIVVDAMVRLSRLAWKKDRPQFQFRVNVHDDLTYYIPEKSLDRDIDFITKEMVLCPFDFVTVPLTVEVAIGDTWGSMEDIKVVSSTDFLT